MCVSTFRASAAESRWIRLQSPNFELYTSAGPRNARDTLREFEQVRGFFIQAFGGPPAKAMPVRLVTFGSQREYEPYRINEFATAFYHQARGRDYIVMSHGGADTFPIAVHEYVHLLVRHSELNLPPWLNEGLAELYSTLRPMGDKILVGDLISGRHRALLEDKWVPLSVILAAGHDSPYYNEKDKAGSLYNEGWALTHMLYFRPEYRGKFGDFMRTVSGGTDSAAALQQIYGRTVAQIEKDLQAYLRGSSFQGALVSAKLEKTAAEIPAEPLDEFGASIVLADLIGRPGKEAEQRAALERLIQMDPKRPEPYQGLGYLAWRAGRNDQAVEQFGKAYERGSREPGFLWDYGRLLETNHGETAVQVLADLLALDSARLDVRLELAEAQLRASHPVAALATLAPVRAVKPADSARFFRIAVYAHLANGDRKDAAETASHFREIANSARDREEADRLISLAAAGARTVDVQTVEVDGAARPSLKRRDTIAAAPQAAPRERPTAGGRFVDLDCRGNRARMIVETSSGRKAFLIEDPGKVAITAGTDGPVDMNCGPQKTPAKVEIGYDPPAKDQPGIEGIVRTLAFQP
jgi:tetratricopeptide (TPR) repeat protein